MPALGIQHRLKCPRAVAQARRSPGSAIEFEVTKLVLRPSHVQSQGSPHAYATHFACRPRGRQRWKETDLTAPGLDQHFHDSRRAAEIAVDLKGRVSIEHVWI